MEFNLYFVPNIFREKLGEIFFMVTKQSSPSKVALTKVAPPKVALPKVALIKSSPTESSPKQK